MERFAKTGRHQRSGPRAMGPGPGVECRRGVAGAVGSASASVLRVGSFNGVAGDYSSIQAAVDAAHTGDFVLVGPGDYHETGNRVPPGAMGDDRAGAAVLATTPGLHIRGMDRNGVVLDGTKAGAPRCSAATGDQDLGPNDSSGHPTGRNGLVVLKASGTSVENLSACNFVTGSGGGGRRALDGRRGGHRGIRPLVRFAAPSCRPPRPSTPRMRRS